MSDPDILMSDPYIMWSVVFVVGVIQFTVLFVIAVYNRTSDLIAEGIRRGR